MSSPTACHLRHQARPVAVPSHPPDRADCEAFPEQRFHVVADDVQLAVVPAVEETAGPAFLPAQRLVALEEEEGPVADSAGAHHAAEPQRTRGEVAEAPSRPQRPRSHSGCSEMGWRAVSSVAVISASGWFCRSVMGYSAVGSEKRATRSAVCFQAPVSEKSRTLRR